MRTLIVLALLGVFLLVLWLVVDAFDDTSDEVQVRAWGTPQPAYVIEEPTTTSTTRAPSKRPIIRAAQAGPAVLASSINGYPCGDVNDLPPCSVMQRESGGNPNAYNARGCNGHGCFGLWQFSGAWACHFGLSCDIAHWTPEEQTHAARTLWDHGRGCAHWSSC